MQVNDFFNSHPVFRFSEFKQFMENRAQGITEKNAYMTLYNYCKRGRLLHVRKGLYVLKNTNPYQVPINPLLIAAKATEDAVLIYHSALESHGIAYTDFNEHRYLTAYRSNDFAFQGQQYRAIYKPLLNQKNDQEAKIESIISLGIKLRRTNLERTIVDVLDRPELSGGWEEVIRSLDRITVFDAAHAIDYALSSGSASIAAKLGYFFDYQRSEHLSINSKLIERLLPYIPKRPYYIDRKSAVGKGTYIKKWQIIVPNYLHKREWEEPEHDIDY